MQAERGIDNDRASILIVVDSYVPETTSAAKMIQDLARGLVQRGHRVTVLHSKSDSTESLIASEEEGIGVLTVRAGKRPGDGLMARAFAELLLPVKTWIHSRSYLSTQHFDRIVFYSPTIFWGWMVRRIAQRRDAAIYLILRDLFPEWAIDMGLLRRRGPTAIFFRYVARYQYRVADRIGVQSLSNARQFQELYPKYADKVEILWNWREHRAPSSRTLMDPPFPIPKGKVIFFYGGNLGVAQGVSRLVALARWANARTDVHLMIVGSGIAYDQIRQSIDHERLANVSLTPPVPQEQYEVLLSLSNVGVVLLDPALTTHNIPGKLVSYAAAGKPILADVNVGTDLIDLVHAHAAGLVTCADETGFLANAAKLTEQPDLRERLGVGAIQLARSHFSVEKCIAQLLEPRRNPLR